MIDDFAKAYLRDNLRWVRESLLLKLEGLSEYDVRRPLTRTGTNLLGLVKHLALSEARYLGEIFDRPFPQSLPRFEDAGYRNHGHMWVTERETRRRRRLVPTCAAARGRNDRRPADRRARASSRGGPGPTSCCST